MPNGVAVSQTNVLRIVGAAIICLGLAVFHTWPLAAAPHRHSLNYNADAELNAWIVSWVAYALPHEPSRLFAGNIFQPDSRALAYSEPLLVPALAGAPIRWLGGSAVLTFNVLLILGLAATAFAGWWIGFRWTGSYTAGLVTGALVAFNAHLLTRLPHLQAAHAWGLPLVIYLTDRLLEPDVGDARHERRLVVLLALVIAAIAMTSEYWLFFAAVLMAVQAAVGVRTIRGLVRLVSAGLLGLAVALPALIPYLRLAAEGVRRPIEQAAQLSATPAGYLVSMSRIGSAWSHRFVTKDIDVLFPGLVALALAIAGAIVASRFDRRSRIRAAALAGIAVIGFTLSLGPATPFYPLAYRLVVPLQGLRVPARFGYLVLLAIAILAAYGVAALERRIRPIRPGLAMLGGALALAVVTAEAWHGPVKTTPFVGVPRIYSMLEAERARGPVLLVEAPFWPAEAIFGNAEYVLNATEHRTPIVNGYSGYTPDAYRRQAQWFWFFPEAWAVATMRKEGVTHVMVHLEQFGPEAPSVIATLDRQTELELVMNDEAGHRLYRFVTK